MDLESRITGIITEKDQNSVITFCNKVFLQYAGCQSYDDIIGHTDYDLPWQGYADIYRAHELDALAGNHYSIIYPLKDYSGEDRLLLHTKIQKLNEKKEVAGIKCRAVEIINPHAAKFIQTLSQYIPSMQSCFTIGKNYGIKLSKRQQEVLFFLIRGKTTKTIAKILGLSPRTVEDYITILKNKFNCRSKNELVGAAIGKGFLECLPDVTRAQLFMKQLKVD